MPRSPAVANHVAGLLLTSSRRGGPPRTRREVTAVGYLRRSTDRQEQSIPDQKRAIEAYCREHGLSLARCYTDDAISGTSSVGRKAFLQLMSDAQHAGCEFAVVVCYDVKRFGRVDNDEAGYYRHLLRTNGVEVRYASENFAGDGTDDLLRPVKQWQAREESKDLSKVTIRGLLTRSQTGFWMGGAPPYGFDLRYESQGGKFLMRVRYQADGSKAVLSDTERRVRTLERGESVALTRRDRCRLVLGDAVRVEVVRRIFRMYVTERRGFKAISDALNRAKVPSARTSAWAAHYSGQWSMTTVRAILVNPAYCGDMVWNRRTDARFHRIEEGRAVTRSDVTGRRLDRNNRSDWIVVKDAHPPIISRRLWDHAQKLLTEKAASESQRGLNPRTGKPAGGRVVQPAGGWTGPKARFLLSGLCLCAKCNSRYEGYTARSADRNADGSRTKWFSYACGGAIRRGPSVCRLGTVPQDVLESAITGAVLGFYEKFAAESGFKRLQSEARALFGSQGDEVKSELAKLTRRGEKVETIMENLLDNITATNRDLVDRRLAKLKTERQTLQTRCEELELLNVSETEIRQTVTEVRKLMADLRASLDSADLGERQATIRKCVRQAWIDVERRNVSLELYRLPLVTMRPEGVATSAIDVALPQ